MTGMLNVETHFLHLFLFLHSKGVYVPTLVRQILDHSKKIDLEYDPEEPKDGMEKKKKKASWSLKDVRRENNINHKSVFEIIACVLTSFFLTRAY